MNKAFTKESDDSLDDIVPEPKDLLPPGVKNYVTPEGAEQLRSDLRHLTDVERPRVATGDVREAGPVSDADAAKRRRLEAIDRRIRFLRDRLHNMEVVDTKGESTDRVRFGASVTVRDEEDIDKTYRIVGVDEADPAAGKVSWLSPIAKALIGSAEEDIVKVQLPQGEVELEIVTITYSWHG